MNQPASPAFMNKDFEPIRRAQSMTDTLFHFADIFKDELKKWLATKLDSEKETMTIHQAVQEFIPFWRDNDEYTQNQHQILAQNTFMYFFRHDEEFITLAKQVVQGYDDTCHAMRGVPKLDGIPERQRIEYVYHGPIAQRTPSDTPGVTPIDTPDQSMPNSPRTSVSGVSLDLSSLRL